MSLTDQWTADRRDFVLLAKLREELATVEGGGEITERVWERSHELRLRIKVLCQRLKIDDRLAPAPAKSEISYYVPAARRVRTEQEDEIRRAQRERQRRRQHSKRVNACSVCGGKGHNRATCQHG